MKKKLFTILISFIALFFISCGKDAISESSLSNEISNEVTTVIKNKYIPLNDTDMKAVWISQFDSSAVFCEGVMRDEHEFALLARMTAKNVASAGFNTVIFQIRPNGDSFYTSEIFPESRYVTGKYGRKISYDALEIFINAFHEYKLSVQAWINPYRLVTVNEINDIPDKYAVKKMYIDGKLPVVNGRLYFDPSSGEAVNLIVDGAIEALEKYQFDGLHMDDYFYPTLEEYFDAKSFAKSEKDELVDFREESVNNLIFKLYSAVKKTDSRLIFGISPAGNLKSVRKNYCADVFKWCSSDNYIDYIMPQIYFGFLHGSCPFDETVEAWANIIKNKNIKFYVGITLSKAVSGEQDKYAVTDEGKNEWIIHDDVVQRSVKYINENSRCNGFSVFCYQYIFNSVTGEANQAFAEI
ncbi:MAG: family 10 glycosylhydrolase, partial [Clostridia bacterium]